MFEFLSEIYMKYDRYFKIAMSPSLDGILFQDQIREFLNMIGFTDVPRWGSEREVVSLGGQEIDAFARSDDLYIVVDAKTATSLRGRGRGVQSQLRLINGYRQRVIQEIRRRYQPTRGYRDCLFVLWTKDKKILPRHQRLASELGIALRDDFDLRYCKEAYRILENEDIVKNSFLKDLSLQLNRNVFREGAGIDVEAIRTRIGNRRFYTFLIEARYLLKFAYIFRVETNNILASYQRLLNYNKIRNIRRYLRERSGFFANNILVATDENLQLDREDENRTVVPGTLRLPDKPAYLEILDGQHRLLAYSNLTDLMDHCLCVTAISNLNPIERAKLFVVVNREQTKVPPYLLWDMYTLIEPNSLRGTISSFVQRLNDDGPLKDLIRLPRVRSSLAYLSFTNLCLALHRRTYLYSRYGDGNSFSNVVKSFFQVVKEDPALGEDWTRSVQNRGRKGFVCTNNALSIQLYLLSKILRGIDFPNNEEIEAWKRYLRRQMVEPFLQYLNDNRDAENPEDPYGVLRRATTNEGARREAADIIFGNMTH